MSRRLRRSKTRASMGDCADRGAGLSKVGLRARSAPVATPVAVTARKIANGDKRIWIAELVYRSNPRGREKFRFCGVRKLCHLGFVGFVGFIKIARNVGNTGLLGFGTISRGAQNQQVVKGALEIGYASCRARVET